MSLQPLLIGSPLLVLAATLWPTVEPRAGEVRTPARLVRVEVRFEGRPILKGSTSDDGHPDADRVWTYLERVPLEPTEAFAPLLAASDAEDRVELRGADKAESIEVRIAYGGRTDTRRLTVTRIPGDEYGRWRISAEDVEREADHRWITRRQAAGLRDQTLPSKR